MVAEDVVILPAESSISMTGWVVSCDPAAPATGCTANANCVGVPAAVGVKRPLFWVRDPSVAVR
jgi:hypothetical protein